MATFEHAVRSRFTSQVQQLEEAIDRAVAGEEVHLGPLSVSSRGGVLDFQLSGGDELGKHVDAGSLPVEPWGAFFTTMASMADKAGGPGHLQGVCRVWVDRNCGTQVAGRTIGARTTVGMAWDRQKKDQARAALRSDLQKHREQAAQDHPRRERSTYVPDDTRARPADIARLWQRSRHSGRKPASEESISALQTAVGSLPAEFVASLRLHDGFEKAVDGWHYLSLPDDVHPH